MHTRSRKRVFGEGGSPQELARELQYTRESLQTTIEELESANEELKSTNEELQSSNEELQSTKTATVFLDTGLQIRRFTPRATEIIPLTAVDLGRPIKDVASALRDTDLAAYGQQVLKDLAVRQVEVGSSDGHWYIMRVRPYRTVGNVIDGVVITFEDITEQKRVEHALAEPDEQYRTLFELAADPVVVLDVETGAITEFNQRAHADRGYTQEEFADLTLADIEAEESASDVTARR